MIDVMKRALEALKRLNDIDGMYSWVDTEQALRQAIEEAEKQKPVAWLEPEWGEKICPEVGYEATMTEDHPRDLCWIPLYAAPPKREWVGLTVQDYHEFLNLSGFDAFKAIEAKLRERNT
jgi:hypothetical protein